MDVMSNGVRPCGIATVLFCDFSPQVLFQRKAHESVSQSVNQANDAMNPAETHDVKVTDTESFSIFFLLSSFLCVYSFALSQMVLSICGCCFGC